MPKINWDDVEEKDFSPIPEGRYDVTIDEVVTVDKDGNDLVTKDGDEMWRVRFNITGPKYAGRKLFTNLVFNDGGLGNVKKLYSAVFGTKLPKNAQPSDILDEAIAVEVEMKEYKGKMTNSIPYAGFYGADSDEEFN